MEIKLNVTDEKFNEVLQKELDAFSREEIKGIIRECITKKLMEDELITNLLTYKRDSYYSNGYREPSEIMKQAAQKIDLSPAYKEIQDKMISYMKENYQEMMTKVMTLVMINGLTNTYNFQEAVATAINGELCRRANLQC